MSTEDGLGEIPAKLRAMKGTLSAETLGELVLVATWNDAIEAAAQAVESGFERGEYSREQAAAAIRALAK